MIDIITILQSYGQVHKTTDNRGGIETHFLGSKSQTQRYYNLLCQSTEQRQNKLVNMRRQILHFKIV